MKPTGYVLVTPVRNEEATIGITIESVMQQTILPDEWVIVSDQSCDRTDEIVRGYVSRCGFLRLLRLDQRPNRSFASVVFATEAGIAALKTRDFDFIGLLDGDVRLSANYFEELLIRFRGDSNLGLAGGLAIDCYEGHRRRSVQSLGEVAGAVQFFRRACFEKTRPFVAVPEGGWDAITCLCARMHGFKTRTFPELEVDHLKPRNIAEGNVFRRTWKLGVRDYALGYHPLFAFAKYARRCFEYPFLLGGVMRGSGYAWSCLSRRRRVLSAEIVQFIRREQLRRLCEFRHPGLSFHGPASA